MIPGPRLTLGPATALAGWPAPPPPDEAERVAGDVRQEASGQATAASSRAGVAYWRPAVLCRRGESVSSGTYHAGWPDPSVHAVGEVHEGRVVGRVEAGPGEQCLVAGDQIGVPQRPRLVLGGYFHE